MIYKQVSPSPELQEYVKGFHLIHFTLKDLSVKPVRTYFPRVEQCLTFDPLGRITATNKYTRQIIHRPAAYISRQQTTTYDLVFPENYLMLKIVFQPGALYRLFGVPLSEFGEQYLDAEVIIRNDVERVNDQLRNAGSYASMIQVAEQYVMEKIKKEKKARQPIADLYTMMAGNEAPFSVDALARQACLSTRQLERKFLEQIGVSPVTYHRLIRFNKAVVLKEDQPRLSWFAVAIYCGYTDLQHLIKDFRQFSANTPTGLLQEENSALQRQLKLV